ncbi:hypothetical protein BKA70DRAFT_13800 [Coprinopsis sp. MPI-PUGE-AT-0042]|nr:hypothetical protein BKA70DRAFT_13800 [Coprinopsis sp. MPI-PUGE-AT-0042]
MAPKRKRRTPPAKGLAPGEPLKRFLLPSSSSTPWSWVDSEVKDPAEITHEHRLAAYGFSAKSGFPACRNKYAPQPEKGTSLLAEDDGDVIVISDDDENPQCSKKLCKNNPRCLNYLGQELWDSEAKAQAQFTKLIEQNDNPMHLSRDPDSPIGLKNLGATCYANSSLQVWFRDLVFRNGVYGCQVPDGREEEFKESPIFNLQVTFAALQEGKESVYNPLKLVESLHLRATEQQDAQEFSKLFMSHLDAEFKKQSDASVRDLVAAQFQGKQVYGTICHSCKYTSERSSDFLEIEANSRLEDRIKESLEPETLSNDNQYLCPQCDSLQDATRYTELRQLPPVLHFSLLRFVYDLSTMERKKSKHAITFPAVLKMSQFLGKSARESVVAPEGVEELDYELRGILLHKGNSAYHGHYEAQVYDTQFGSWFQFNDEDVTKISLFGDKRCSSKDALVERDKGKKNQKRRRIVVSEDDEPSPRKTPEPPEQVISSKDAYMLVYTRKDMPTDSDDKGVPALPPPPLAMQVVEKLNEAHDATCEAYEKSTHDLKAEFQRKRQVVMEIYSNWHVDNTKEDSIVVSQQALNDWLSKRCFEQCAPQSSTANGCEENSSIPNDAIVCSHGKLDPSAQPQMKIIAKGAYDSIVSETQTRFSPVLRVADICEECVASQFNAKIYDVEHPRIVREFEKVQEVEDDSLDDGCWISRPWLKDWRLQKPRMHVAGRPDPPPDIPEFAEHVRCDHGELIPATINRRKISTEAKSILQDLFPTWKPPSGNDIVCAICQDSLALSKEDKREMRRKAEEEKAKLKHMNPTALRFFSSAETDESCAIIPTQFYTSWKRWVDSPTIHPRPDEINTKSLLCTHEKFLYDPNSPEDVSSMITVIRLNELEVLSGFYPTGPSIHLQRNVTPNSVACFTHMEPEVCFECNMHRRLNWDSAEINVQLTSAGKREDHQKDQADRFGTSSLRQSRRLRNKQEVRHRITVTKPMTVKDLKVEISAEFEIPTICQKLFFKDEELIDNEATIESLAIAANDTLYLEQISEALEVDSDSEQPAKRRRREEGQGFNGTILGGFSTDSSQPSSRANTPGSLMAEKPCKSCTFSNPAHAQSCEMCENDF